MIDKLIEYLPFIIPLAVAQFALMGISVYHILTHQHYKKGSRRLWLVLAILINFIGPILYFTIGKEDY